MDLLSESSTRCCLLLATDIACAYRPFLGLAGDCYVFSQMVRRVALDDKFAQADPTTIGSLAASLSVEMNKSFLRPSIRWMNDWSATLLGPSDAAFDKDIAEVFYDFQRQWHDRAWEWGVALDFKPGGILTRIAGATERDLTHLAIRLDEIGTRVGSIFGGPKASTISAIDERLLSLALRSKDREENFRVATAVCRKACMLRVFRRALRETLDCLAPGSARELLRALRAESGTGIRLYADTLTLTGSEEWPAERAVLTAQSCSQDVHCRGVDQLGSILLLGALVDLSLDAVAGFAGWNGMCNSPYAWQRLARDLVQKFWYWVPAVMAGELKSKEDEYEPLVRELPVVASAIGTYFSPDYVKALCLWAVEPWFDPLMAHTEPWGQYLANRGENRPRSSSNLQEWKEHVFQFPCEGVSLWDRKLMSQMNSWKAEADTTCCIWRRIVRRLENWDEGWPDALPTI